MDERNEYLDALFLQHRDRLIKYCLRVVRYDPRYTGLVEDWVQEAFLSATEGYDAFMDSPNQFGWLARCCKNRILTELRNRNARRELAGTHISLENNAEVPASVDYVLRLLNKTDAEDRLNQLCEALTQSERLVYDAYFVKGYSMAETAELTGLTLSAVKNAVQRIRKKAKSLGI